VRLTFGPFTLDSGTRQLIEGARTVHLEPKAFDLLLALVTERPNVISKAELQRRLWPHTFVAEANVSNLVAEVRAALGDRPRAPRYIRTVHGVGYAFCGIATAERSGSIRTAVTACWLEWGRRRFPLAPGEQIVGRDPDVEVQLDASTVSRRHARLLVRPNGVTLEDDGSKNGTFLGDDRVTSPVALNDGDLIHFGSLVVTFRQRGRAGTTETQRSGDQRTRRRAQSPD
jgi:DNA-binding winged helix-turn-helix (wHTH) protein